MLQTKLSVQKELRKKFFAMAIGNAMESFGL
jgi:hypothetical protein